MMPAPIPPPAPTMPRCARSHPVRRYTRAPDAAEIREVCDAVEALERFKQDEVVGIEIPLHDAQRITQVLAGATAIIGDDAPRLAARARGIEMAARRQLSNWARQCAKAVADAGGSAMEGSLPPCHKYRRVSEPDIGMNRYVGWLWENSSQDNQDGPWPTMLTAQEWLEAMAPAGQWEVWESWGYNIHAGFGYGPSSRPLPARAADQILIGEKVSTDGHGQWTAWEWGIRPLDAEAREVAALWRQMAHMAAKDRLPRWDGQQPTVWQPTVWAVMLAWLPHMD